MAKVTVGHVLLSSHTTRTADNLCSLQDDGTEQHHHTSVSCSKVCPTSTTSNFILLCLYTIYAVDHLGHSYPIMLSVLAQLLLDIHGWGIKFGVVVRKQILRRRCNGLL